MNTFASKKELVAYLSSVGLGLKRKSVDVQVHRSNWSQAFERVKEQIASALATIARPQIEHVGSTSIPGLSAKPVLDILVAWNDRNSVERSIPLLQKLGFSYKGDAVSLVNQTTADPDRHFFSYYNENEDTDFIHIHMHQKNNVHATQLLKFRDVLRKNQGLRKEYEDLKQSLWTSGLTRQEYTRSKNGFIEKVLQYFSLNS